MHNSLSLYKDWARIYTQLLLLNCRDGRGEVLLLVFSYKKAVASVFFTFSCLLTLMDSCCLLQAALWRGPHDSNLKEAPAKRVSKKPKPYIKYSMGNKILPAPWMSLEADPSPPKPSDETTVCLTPDCNLSGAPEPENSAE